jgi:hypothetical protein
MKLWKMNGMKKSQKQGNAVEAAQELLLEKAWKALREEESAV